MERLGYFIGQRLGGQLFSAIYTANFLLAVHLFLVLYINSTYLATFVPESFVGFIYIAGSALGLSALLLASRILAHFGIIRTMSILVLLEFLAFIGLAFPGHPLIALALYLIHFPVGLLILYALDIFVETLTQDESTTGNIRGIFLTATSIGIVISPIIAGFVLGDDQYWRIYLLSAITLIPFILIMRHWFKNFEDPVYHPLKIRPLLTCLSGNENVLKIFKAHFIMRLFFVWMVIYTPIYLHQHVGFGWGEIGAIFTIMLLPYLLLELPAGKLADGVLGEKELLSIGFVITALAVAAMPFATAPLFALWAGILFMTRAGAALIEIMTETYFFRHVDKNDMNTISTFRMLRPISYILGSFLGVISLAFVDIQYMFLILAAILLLGLRYSLTLRDSK